MVKKMVLLARPNGTPQPMVVYVRPSTQQQSRLRCHMLVPGPGGKPVQLADVRLEMN